MKIDINIFGNSKVIQIFFFHEDPSDILDDFTENSFSKYLENKSQYSTYIAKGFSDSGDLNIIIKSDNEQIYNGPLYQRNGYQDDTLSEISENFLNENGLHLDKVISFEDWKRIPPDAFIKDINNFNYCIIRSIDQDGYSSLAQVTINVQSEFNLSEVKGLMGDFDAVSCSSRSTDNLMSIICESGIETELLGFSYASENYLISDKSFECDVLSTPYSFIETTEYSAFEKSGEDWNYMDDLYDILAEHGETEEE